MALSDSIQDEKKRLRAEWEKGTKCGCCGQTVKLYKRKFNSGIAIFLIKLYHLTKDGQFVHASEALVGTKSLDYSILRHWRLIEEDEIEVDGKRQSGFWRVSSKGKRFVEGEVDIPSHIHLYNNLVVGYSDTQTDIKKALKEDFEYDELMNA